MNFSSERTISASGSGGRWGMSRKSAIEIRASMPARRHSSLRDRPGRSQAVSTSAAPSSTVSEASTQWLSGRGERKKLRYGKVVCDSPTSMNQSSQPSHTSSS